MTFAQRLTDRAYGLLRSNRILWLLSVMVLVDRFLLLESFGFAYVGSDDLVFWQGATDYANGVFHEPYFYGQNYNYMLEALFAAPLILLGVPHHIALPLITSAVALFPFFLFAFVLHRNGQALGAFVFLLMPLLLPVEYGIISSMTRGFVSGLFFSGFLVFSLMDPRSIRSFVVLTLAGSFGYIFNPNSVVFALAVGTYLLVLNFRRPVFYSIVVLGAIPALLAQWASREFYERNEAFRVHWMWDLSYSASDLINSFTRLDVYFSYLTPIAWSFGWSFLILLILIAFRLRKSEGARSVAIFVAVIFILAMLGLNKVADNTGTLFLSSVRMFLAVPLLLALGLAWLCERLDVPMRNLGVISFSLATIFLFVKAGVVRTITEQSITIPESQPIQVKPFDLVKRNCDKLARTVKEHDIGLVVLVPDQNISVPSMQYLDIACGLMQPGLPSTLMNVYERRTWVFLAEQEIVYRNILIYGRTVDIDLLPNMNGRWIRKLDPATVLIKGNTERTRTVLDALKIELRRNTY